jgi:hypothetical protein
MTIMTLKRGEKKENKMEEEAKRNKNNGEIVKQKGQ